MKSLLLIVLLMFSFIVKADKINFAYDENGNRVSRIFTIGNPNKVKGKTADAVDTYFEELNKRGIKISHNAYGRIQIEIMDFESADVACASIYSIGGLEVFSGEISDYITDIDISAKATGVYILTIVLNGEQTVWKIIKE